MYRSDAAASRETQDKILEKIAHDTDHLNNRIDQALGTAYIGFITKRLGEERRGDVGESLKSAILDAIYNSEINSSTTEPRIFELPPVRRQSLKEELLSKMAYPDIFTREESVAKAHEKTFQWIFEKEKQQDVSWASFCQWLEAPDEKLYWITGKAGSGKSTLMSFVSQPPAGDNSSTQPNSSESQPPCFPFLKKWAGSQPLLIASFYFWAVGSPMQRSKEGMLRTLLHELLKQAEPEAIAMIAPASWEALCLFDEDPRQYSEDLLLTMLSRALHHLSEDHKICIFIDGLDEFKGQHGDLVEFFRDVLLVREHPIKLCISSRPWQVFEDAFQDKPSLKLEALTLPDITAYIQSHLHPDPAFALLKTLEPSFSDNLVRNIAAKADGVFLWVNLVVASLQKGIKAGDRVSDLQKRLDQLPQDLEGLFGRILDDLDPEYLDHAMQYFQLMEASLSVAPPNVMVFAYADEEDENFGVDFPIAPIDKTIFEATTAVLKKRLNSRCLGLLEITEQSEELEGVFVDASRSRVKYLHRTVRDYLARADVQETLRSRSRKGLGPYQSFDPHLRLCSAQLAFCKSSHLRIEPNDRYAPTVPDLGDKVVSATFRSLSACLRHAAKVQDAGLPHMVRLLDSLEMVCSRVFRNYRCCNQFFVMVSHESYRLARGLDRYERAYERRDYLFTSLIIQHHVVEYMRAKVRHRPHRVALLSTKLMMQIKPLFQKRRVDLERGRYTVLQADRALHLDMQLHDAVVTTLPCPEIVQLLLERGADPQYTHKGRALKEPSSYWELALAAYMIMYRENPSQEYVWEQVVRLMVRHGAPVRRANVHKALRVVQGVRSGGEEWGEALCDAVETNLKLMKREA